jgi:hypothetical protein
MTKQEELTYLFGILSEASKWTASADDNRDLVRMEVEERIHNLINGVEPEPDENGLIQSSIHPDVTPVLTEDDYRALEAAKVDEHLNEKREKQKLFKQRWKQGRVRVTIDGKPVWKLESDCHKEIIPGFEKKWHWVWNGADGKQEQDERT